MFTTDEAGKEEPEPFFRKVRSRNVRKPETPECALSVSQPVRWAGQAGSPATEFLCSGLNPVSGLSATTAGQEERDGMREGGRAGLWVQEHESGGCV